MAEFVGLHNEELSLDATNVENVVLQAALKYNISHDMVYISSNGASLTFGTNIISGKCYYIHLKTCGGKGGFGSMLRAIGAQIEKTTNHGACRDLNGRRMRDVDAEKELREWVQKNKDKELEKEKKKQEVRDKFLNPGKYFIQDTEFIKQRSEVSEKVYDAVEQGIPNATELEVKLSKRKLVDDSDEKMNKLFKQEYDNVSLSSDDLEVDNEELFEKPSTSKAYSGSFIDDNNNYNALKPTTSSPKKDIAFEVINMYKTSNMTNEKTIIVQNENIAVKQILSESDTNEITNELHSNSKETKLTLSPLLVKNEGPLKNALREPYPEIYIDPSCKSALELEVLGLDALKNELKRRGMKCGGTLKERAKRLFQALKNNG